jgi:hypothetical protein
VGRAYSTHGEKRNAYRIFVGKPEEKRPLGRPIRRWQDIIKIDLREMGDHPCALVARVSGYRYRGPGFDSRRFQIF